MGSYNNIIFTNDVHSSISEWAQLFGSLKLDKSVLIDNGDFIEGSAFYNLFNGKPEEYILGKYYNLVSVGNHGFKHYENIKDKPHVLNLNIYKDNHLLFKDYRRKKLGNIYVNFIGFMSQEAFNSIPLEERNGLVFKENFELLRKYVKEIVEKREKTVILSHSGIKFDINLAKSIPEIDLIISSHCHSNIYIKTVGNTKIIKAREMGKGYGIISWDGNNFSIKILDKGKPLEDKNILGYLNEYKNKSLKKTGCIKDDVLKNNRNQLTSFFVKEMISKFSADGALLNTTIFRNIPKDKMVSDIDLINLSPFDNNIVSFYINSTDFRELVNNYDNVRFVKVRLENKIDKPKVVTSSFLYNNIFKAVDIKDYKEECSFFDFCKILMLGRQ